MFELNYQIPFSDTDAAGIVHFSRASLYVERAEHLALQSVGLDVMNKSYGWPKVAFSVNYAGMLRYSDTITIGVALQRIGNTSLNWIFEIKKAQQLCWQGSFTTVKVGMQGQKIPITEQEYRQLSSLLLEQTEAQA